MIEWKLSSVSTGGAAMQVGPEGDESRVKHCRMCFWARKIRTDGDNESPAFLRISRGLSFWCSGFSSQISPPWRHSFLSPLPWTQAYKGLVRNPEGKGRVWRSIDFSDLNSCFLCGIHTKIHVIRVAHRLHTPFVAPQWVLYPNSCHYLFSYLYL